MSCCPNRRVIRLSSNAGLNAVAFYRKFWRDIEKKNWKFYFLQIYFLFIINFIDIKIIAIRVFNLAFRNANRTISIILRYCHLSVFPLQLFPYRSSELRKKRCNTTASWMKCAQPATTWATKRYIYKESIILTTSELTRLTAFARCRRCSSS